MTNTNIQILLLAVWTSFFAFSCSEDKSKEKNTGSETVENTDTEEVDTVEVESTLPDYQTLIQGHWQTEDGEGKIQFEGESVYNPEQEIDRTFEVKNNTLTYKSAEGSYTNKILELSEKRFVEESEDGYKTVWVRPQKTKMEVSLEGE